MNVNSIHMLAVFISIYKIIWCDYTVITPEGPQALA